MGIRKMKKVIFNFPTQSSTEVMNRSYMYVDLRSKSN